MNLRRAKGERSYLQEAKGIIEHRWQLYDRLQSSSQRLVQDIVILVLTELGAMGAKCGGSGGNFRPGTRIGDCW